MVKKAWSLQPYLPLVVIWDKTLIEAGWVVVIGPNGSFLFFRVSFVIYLWFLELMVPWLGHGPL